MPISDDPIRALDDLLRTLSRHGAVDLAQAIRSAVSRGTIREIESQRGKREEALRPYEPSEAYVLAAHMLLAAIDPALMVDQARRAFADILGAPAKLAWRPDFLEGAAPDDAALAASALSPFPERQVASLRTAATSVLHALRSVERTS